MIPQGAWHRLAATFLTEHAVRLRATNRSNWPVWLWKARVLAYAEAIYIPYP
jgi:hypothetical protein